MINQHFTRYIVPFLFDVKRSAEIISHISHFDLIKSNGKPVKVFESFSNEEVNDFFLPHTQSFLSAKLAGNFDKITNDYIARYHFTKDALNLLFKWNNQISWLTASLNKIKDIRFEVDAAEIYILNSGIGFLVIECSLPDNQTPEEIISFNYIMQYVYADEKTKRGNYSANIGFDKKDFNLKTFDYLQQNMKNYNEWFETAGLPNVFQRMHHYHFNEVLEINYPKNVDEQKVTFAEIINGLISIGLGGNDIQFKFILGSRIPIFTYLFCEPLEIDKKMNLLYYLRRVNRPGFLPTDEDLSMDSPQIINTYNNISFGASLEGAVVLVEDSKQDFFNTFDKIVRDAYFIIYLISLHNRIALINFRQKLDMLFASDIRKVSIDKKLREKARDLLKQTMSFFINAYFVQLSNNTSHEKVYQHFNSQFSIETLLDEILTKTRELDDFLKSDIEEKSNQWIARITILSFIFIPISIITGIFGMNIINSSPSHKTFSLFDFISMNVVLYLIIIAFLIPLWIKNKKKKGKN